MKKKEAVGAVRYALRFNILPDKNAVSRAKELARFCKKHRVTEVHLFCNAEEWNRGHLTEPEIQEVESLFRKIVPLLKEAGLSVNLNPWTTYLHGDRGRTLRDGQDFELMVSPSGERARAVVSPACPKWRRYVADFYGRMAKLGFETIWLEDDFRYHGHDPITDWGGDFGETMLKNFSRKAGRKVTREEVVKNVLKPGKPHPWRKLWLELWRETSEANAAAIKEAVRAANPNARLGLMSSNVDVHSAEGRRWGSLFKALAINGRAIHRPNAKNIPFSLDISKNFRPEWVESYPDMENGPYSRFIRADIATFSSMALSKVMGSEGLLLNQHPFSGNGVFEEAGIGELLDKSFPALNYLSKTFSRKMNSAGCGIPFKEDAAETIRTDSAKSYENLVSSSFPPAQLLSACGIACQMRRSDTVNLVWGKKAWSFSDNEVTDLLKRGLWLDGEAAAILAGRGFEEYLGIEIEGWLSRQGSAYGLERVAAKESGVRAGFNFRLRDFTRILKFKHRQKAAASWTGIFDCFDRPLGTGLSVFKNGSGGTVAVSALPLNEELPDWHLNFQRQTLVKNLITALSGGKNPPVMVSGAPHAFPIDLRYGTVRRVVIFNSWPDPAKIAVNIPGAKKISGCTLIEPLKVPRKVKFRVTKDKEGITVIPSAVLPLYGMAVLEVV